MDKKSDKYKKALIIRAGRLGDTVWATTVIEPIRAYLGEHTKIDLLLKRGMGTIFEHDNRIETVYEIEHRSVPLLLSRTKLAVLYSSFMQKYDLVVLLEAGSHFHSLMHYLRAGIKIFEKAVVHDVLLEGNNMVNVTANILAQGIPASFCRNAKPSLRPSGNIRSVDITGKNNKYICLHPGNSMLARNKPALRAWPEAYWSELVKLAVNNFPDMDIVLIGEKNESDLGKSIAESFTGVINLCGKTSLQQLMVVLADAQALVTTDTGPAHVAAALSTPVIAVFGPSGAAGTGPVAALNGWATSVLRSVGCNPCVNTEQATLCNDNICMQAVSPEDILDLLTKALSRETVAPVIVLD